MQRHSMTPEQIDLVRKSFDALWPFRRKLAEQFYGRFFELAPDTRRLFPDDMERQQLKLMDTIAAIVATLDQGEIFQSIISHTGRKHADFGVQTSHFIAFGEALIWGLQRQFGPAFTRDASGVDRALRCDPGGNDTCRKKRVLKIGSN
jgi:hemoglobin-like flavoprotein